MRFKISWLLVIIVITLNLYADIQVNFGKTKKKEFIKTVNINDIEYFSVFELQRVFKAGNILEDRYENRLNISLYNETLMILLNSSYSSFRGKLYNFNYEVIYKEGLWLLPVNFLQENLTQMYPSKIKYNAKNYQISAEPVYDTRIKVIVLDPGHGGKDPGARGRMSNEKDLTLEMAFLVKKKLEQNFEGVKVLMTRSKDEFVSLQERTKFANKNQAHLFVSLHCNAALAKSSQGIETFFLSTARTTESRAVEALENSVVMNYEGGQEAVKNYDDLQLILADLHQSEQLEESSNLALRIQGSLIDNSQSIDRGVKQAGFYVLRGAFMPAVLVELGFISNEAEEKKLLDKSYQDKLTDAIVLGIKSFKQKYDYIQ